MRGVEGSCRTRRRDRAPTPRGGAARRGDRARPAPNARSGSALPGGRAARPRAGRGSDRRPSSRRPRPSSGAARRRAGRRWRGGSAPRRSWPSSLLTGAPPPPPPPPSHGGLDLALDPLLASPRRRRACRSLKLRSRRVSGTRASRTPTACEQRALGARVGLAEVLQRQRRVPVRIEPEGRLGDELLGGVEQLDPVPAPAERLELILVVVRRRRDVRGPVLGGGRLHEQEPQARRAGAGRRWGWWDRRRAAPRRRA